MMNNPKVSVVLTSYNKAAFIGAAIESVLMQTFQDFEIIIVDDGSTDSSMQIIDKYAKDDQRIKSHYFNGNQGIPSAHNKAISMACGNYIAMLDCDDFWQPDKLEKQVDFLDTHCEYGACFSWIAVVNEEGKSISSEECEKRDIMWNSDNHTRGEWLRLFFSEGCKLGNPSMLVRKYVIDEVGVYSYGLKQLQDYELFIRILKRYNVYIIKEKLVNYRWFMGNTKNTSYDNIENANRTNVEYYLIGRSFFDNISIDIFEEGFGKWVIEVWDRCEQNMLCEQVFILKDRYVCKIAGKIVAMEFMYKFLNDTSLRQVLEKRYNFHSSNFSKELKTGLLFDPKYYMPINQEVFNSQLKKEIADFKQKQYESDTYIRELVTTAKEAEVLIDQYEQQHRNSIIYIQDLETKAKEAACLIEQYEQEYRNLTAYIRELETKEREAAALVEDYKQEQENAKRYIEELEKRVRESYNE